MTEQQFYGEIAKMIMEALKRVEHDLNLAVGEMKITLELIKLDRFRVTSMLMAAATSASWKSCLLQGEQYPPLYPLKKGGMTRGCSPRGA